MAIAASWGLDLRFASARSLLQRRLWHPCPTKGTGARATVKFDIGLFPIPYSGDRDTFQRTEQDHVQDFKDPISSLVMVSS